MMVVRQLLITAILCGFWTYENDRTTLFATILLLLTIGITTCLKEQLLVQPFAKKENKSKIACIFIYGQKLPYNVNLYDTVVEFKAKIGERIGSDVKRDQYLSFAGRVLSNDKRLLDCNVQKHSTLFLCGRLIGGVSEAMKSAGQRRVSLQQQRNAAVTGTTGISPAMGIAARQRALRHRMSTSQQVQQHSTDETNESNKNNETDTNRTSEKSSNDTEPSKESVDKIKTSGLIFGGYDLERQSICGTKQNEIRFRALYGIGTLAATKLYRDLRLINEKNNIVQNIDNHHFFMTLHWLKAYPTYMILEAQWKVCYQRVGNIVKEYARAIQSLLGQKIKWFTEGELNDDDVFIVSVDGVHCRIREVRKDPGSKWFSHKFNGPGLVYELSLAVRDNRLVSVKGPFPASKNDLTIFLYGDGDKKNPKPSLKDKIPSGKRAIADNIYKPEDGITCSVTRRTDSKEVREFKGRVKSRQETFNSRIKSFSILSTEFRHDISYHKMAMESVCILCQYDIENGKPLFEV